MLMFNKVIIFKCKFLPSLIFDALCSNKIDAGLGDIASNNIEPNKQHR